jgi:hypothetical protein
MRTLRFVAGLIWTARKIQSDPLLDSVTDRVWDMNDVAALIAAQVAPVAMRGPCKKKTA